MARSSRTTVPQQPKARLYGRKAREMRRRDNTTGFRQSWRNDWLDGRSQLQENFNWNSQDNLTAQQIREIMDSEYFMSQLYADEFPEVHYAPYSTESRGFTCIQPVRREPSKALAPSREQRPRRTHTARAPMGREEYRELARMQGYTGRGRVHLIG